MNKSNQNRRQQPRDAEGRFESRNQVRQGGMSRSKTPSHAHRTPARDAEGRFEGKNRKW